MFIMPIKVEKYLADTRHLTLVERGAFDLLLMEDWRRGCRGLQDDDEALASYIGRSVKAWQQLRPRILSILHRDGRSKRLSYPPLKEQYARAVNLSAKNSDKAKARWKEEKKPNAAVSSELSHCNAPKTKHIPKSRHENGPEGLLEEEEEARSRRVRAKEKNKREEEGSSNEDHELYQKVMMAAKIPQPPLSKYWQAPSAIAHVKSWRALGVKDHWIVEIVRTTTEKWSQTEGWQPMSGPKAYDEYMRIHVRWESESGISMDDAIKRIPPKPSAGG